MGGNITIIGGFGVAINPNVVPFAEWRPDVSDLNAQYTSNVLNVLPRGDGYGPFLNQVPFSSALPTACRGYFYARDGDELVVFAATSTRIYQLDSPDLDWNDVSQGGIAYTPLTDNENWQFAQFNNFVIAVQANEDPQVFQIGTSSAFADLGGTPPKARYISVINRFLVLSGLLDNPYRVHWSDLNDITEWTAGTGLCDFQDLPDGGVVRGVVGGEFGVIIQDGAMRRMVFAAGSDVIFQIDRISKDTGALAPYSIINAGERIFFLSSRGFVMTDASGAISPIGKERVDRTFLAHFDATALGLMIGVADPKSNLVLWSYKSADGGIEGVFDHLICYDWVLNRWTLVQQEGEYIAALARPGQSLESLDMIGSVAVSGAVNNGSGLIRLTVASTAGWTTGDSKTIASVGGVPNAHGTFLITVISGTQIDLQGSTFAGTYTSGGYVAGSLDDLDFSLDTIEAATAPQLSMVDNDHQVGFFTGDALQATLETAEIANHGLRLLVNGFFSIGDAPNMTGTLGSRDTLYATSAYTADSVMNEDGFIPFLGEGRYVRGRVVIPEAEVWSYVQGLVPDVIQAGRL